MYEYYFMVTAQDQIYIKIIKSLYSTPGNVDDYKLLEIGDDSVKAWVKEDHVIICIRGTSILSARGVSNLLDDITLATKGGCYLAAVKTGTAVLQDILQQGYSNITVCGHSLGGAAAFCLGEKFPNITCVAFNSAAPITSPRTVPSNGKAYHIIGDLISTHIGGNVVRLLVKHKEPNWINTLYYHGVDRFNDSMEIESAQYEQDSLEKFITKQTLLTTAFKFFANPVYRMIKNLVCTRPIPGSVASCKGQNVVVPTISNLTPLQVANVSLSNLKLGRSRKRARIK